MNEYALDDHRMRKSGLPNPTELFYATVGKQLSHALLILYHCSDFRCSYRHVYSDPASMGSL